MSNSWTVIRDVDVSGGFTPDPDWVADNKLRSALSVGSLVLGSQEGSKGIAYVVVFYDVDSNPIVSSDAEVDLEMIAVISRDNTSILRSTPEFTISETIDFSFTNATGHFVARLLDVRNIPIGSDTMRVFVRTTSAASIAGLLTSEVAGLKQSVGALNSTSIRWGGALTINADTESVDISSFVIDVVDNYSGPETVSQCLDHPGYTAYVPVNKGTQSSTFLALGSNGSIVESATPWTNGQRRDVNPIGRAIHTNHVNIEAIELDGSPKYDIVLQLHDLFKAIGSVNIRGNQIEAIPTTLQFKKTAGETLTYGAHRIEEPKTPHDLGTAHNVELNPVSFGYLFHDLAQPANNPFTISVPHTAIDPEHWDDSTYETGVNENLANVSPNKWTIQPVFYLPSSMKIRIHYGQELFNSSNNAFEALDRKDYEFDDFLRDGVFLGSWIVKQGASDLDDDTEAIFKRGSKINLHANL